MLGVKLHLMNILPHFLLCSLFPPHRPAPLHRIFADLLGTTFFEPLHDQLDTGEVKDSEV